jgi:thiol-disulfide isomerase/thioredoxin
MRLLVLLLVLCSNVHGWLFNSAPQAADLSIPVAILTDDSFDEALATSYSKPWLLKFYAPWCGHCQKLAPVFEEAAHNIRGLRFAKIDVTQNAFLGKRYHVKSFPTLMWLRDERLRAYDGPNTAEGFAALADKLAGDPVIQLETDGTNGVLQKLRQLWHIEVANKTNGVLFLAVGDDVDGTDGKKGLQLQTAFRTTASQFHDTIAFARVSSAEFASMMSVPEHAKEVYGMLGLLGSETSSNILVVEDVDGSSAASSDSAAVSAAAEERRQRWSGWRQKLLTSNLSPPFVARLSSGSKAAAKERAHMRVTEARTASSGNGGGSGHGEEADGAAANVGTASMGASDVGNYPGAGEGEGELPIFAPMERLQSQGNKNVRAVSATLTQWVSEHEWPSIRNLSTHGKGWRSITRSHTGRKAVVAVFQRAAHEAPIRRALLEHIQRQDGKQQRYMYGTMNVAVAGARWAKSLSGYGCGDGTAAGASGTSRKTATTSSAEALPCLVILELDNDGEDGGRFWPSTVRGKSVVYKVGSASSQQPLAPSTPAGWQERLQQDVEAAVTQLQAGIDHGLIEPRYTVGHYALYTVLTSDPSHFKVHRYVGGA